MNNPLAPSKSKDKKEQVLIPGEEIIKRFSDMNERLRLLEERLKHTHQKVQVIDETNVRKINEVSMKVKNIEEQLSTMRTDFEKTNEVLRRLAKDMSQSAKISDVKVLEKYINLVDITRLVTKEDVERYVDEYLQEIKQHKKKR